MKYLTEIQKLGVPQEKITWWCLQFALRCPHPVCPSFQSFLAQGCSVAMCYFLAGYLRYILGKMTYSSCQGPLVPENRPSDSDFIGGISRQSREYWAFELLFRP